MSTAMDIFLNASDSLPFPDFLDIDIKTDSDILLGGHSQNDFSGFNFEPIELTEDSKWFLNNTSSNNSNQSIFDFSSGDDGPAMVNPNVVLPLAVSLTGGAFGNNGRSPSPSCGGVKGVGESHLSFSPAAIKISSILQHDKSSKVSNVKKDLINRLNNNIRHQSVNNKKSQSLPILASKPVMSAPTNTVLARQNQLTVQQSPTVRKTFGSIVNRSAAATLLEPSNSIIMTAAQPNHQKQKNNNHHLSFLTATTAAAAAATTNDTFCQKVFPKPAYSYSCLIAMALKNSRNGSLPVSEIYSFMCQHFPYFKTAPNGWKNSVRHNLSLNKCFEKIDKPTVNGAQRKGCLWAMNPAKITKMDEEVQKWSRKDPNAIKKAMVNPEHLEFLERGELKFSCQFDDDVDDDAMTVSTKMAAVPLLSDTSSMTSADSDVDEEVMEGGVEERGQTNDVDVDDVSLEYVQMTDDEDVDDDDGDDANGEGATFNKKPIIISNKRRRTYMV